MTPRRVAILFVAAAAGCPASHEDGGQDAAATVQDGGALDASGRDGGLTDAHTADVPRDCSEVGGVRRCGPSCPDLCPDRLRCRDSYGLCLPRREDVGCGYDLNLPGQDPPFLWDPFCADGTSCAVPGETPFTSGIGGTCMDPELCLVAAGAEGLPPFQCFYSDMTPVEWLPPAATCPASDPRAPFCGGACGPVDCPQTHFAGGGVDAGCVGVSNTRGFGVCAYLPIRCDATVIEPGLRGCETEYGEPCACMLLHPAPADDPRPSGVWVLASACLAYEAVYPEGVECRDESWREL